MTDLPRLRDDSASFEGRLLSSSTRLDPPDSAEEELWQRLELASAVGAAGVLGGAASHASAAIASRAAGTALAAHLIKWGGIAVIAVSAVTVTTLWVLPHRSASAPPAAARGAASPLGPQSLANAAPSAPPASGDTASVMLDAPSADANPRAALPGSTDRASQLRVESGKLRAARSKLGAGDFRGALADIARLSAQFPHGVLSQEREVVAIDALTGLGESAAARARAQAFLTHCPDSPYAARLRPLISGN
jgi:hypothetical protein